jgi:abequosyltransferase
MIDILIPTFNRCTSLKKNLLVLNELLKNENLNEQFQVLVSNNCSSDNTESMLNDIGSHLCFRLIVYTQTKNIGLEPNAVFLLANSTSDYVIYLGDDDYLPEGYLTRIYQLVKEDPNLGVVIPGFTTVDVDGNTRIGRKKLETDVVCGRGFLSVLKFSTYGHQLSGLALRRHELLKTYVENPELRNIYPFIYFVAKNNFEFKTVYAPRFQVLVSVSNTKDWLYDEMGLLCEVLKNYNILFKDSLAKQIVSSCVFVFRQSWRLRISMRPSSYGLTLKALRAFLESKVPSTLLKITVVAGLPILYLKQLVDSITRRLPLNSKS